MSPMLNNLELSKIPLCMKESKASIKKAACNKSYLSAYYIHPTRNSCAFRR